MDATTIVGLLTVFLLAVLMAIRRNQYWAKQGVKQYKPLPFIGDMLTVILRRQTLGELFVDIAKELPNEPVVGIYFFMKPMLLINDFSLVERVMIKDFPYFTDRGPQPDIKKDISQMTMFSAAGNLWRAIRSRFSPMFTTGKLRNMFPQVVKISDQFMELLKSKPDKIDLTDYFGKFAMEIIGETAFGIEGRAMEENSKFREMGKRLFEPSLKNFLRFTVAPSIIDLLGLPAIPTDMTSYFGDAVKTALAHRRRASGTRHDFIQHMVTLQQQGCITIEKSDESDEILMMDSVPDTKLEMTDDLMVGQSMGFMTAGFDATALTMGWMSYEMALNPEMQSKIRNEVREVLAKHENRLDYDSARDMKYLMRFIKETGRVHPILDSNFRIATKTYKVPGTSAVVKPGQYVYIPVLGIHMNPEFYPEPEKFQPDRWTDENDIPSCAHLNFGAGPRMCIAMRFAQMEIISVISKLVTNFEITFHPSVKLPPKIEPYSFFTYPTRKIHFNLKKISS